MQWFRFHTRTLDSGKVQALGFEQFRAWVNLLCVASIHGGMLPDFSEIAFRLRCTETKARSYMNTLETAKLIDRNDEGRFIMHDWNEHQYVSDNSTKRVKKHREKRKGNVSETAPEQNRTETEQNRTEISAAATKPEVSPPPPTVVELKNKLHGFANGKPQPDSARAVSEEAIRKHEWMREVLTEYPGSQGLPGKPDDGIIKACLFAADQDLDVIRKALKEIHEAHKRPSTSWAWFPTVIEVYTKGHRS